MKVSSTATTFLFLVMLYVSTAKQVAVPSLRQLDESSYQLEALPHFPAEELPIEVQFINQKDGQVSNFTYNSQGLREERAGYTRFRGKLEFPSPGRITATLRYPAQGSLSGVVTDYQGVVTWIQPIGSGSLQLTGGGVGYRYVIFKASHPHAKGFHYDFIIYWK